MERKKSRNEEIDLLLNALEADNDSLEELENLDLNNDIVDFLNFFNITAGENKIDLKSLYFYYKNWSNEPVTQLKFNMKISKYFTVDKIKEVSCIFIKNDFQKLNNNVAKIKREKNHLKKSFSLKKHLEKFIQEMEIKEHDKWMDLKSLYKWYIKWRYRRKIIKLTISDFRKLMSFYFESKIGGNKGFFKLKGEFNMEKIEQLRIKHGEKEGKQEVKN